MNTFTYLEAHNSITEHKHSGQITSTQAADLIRDLDDIVRGYMKGTGTLPERQQEYYNVANPTRLCSLNKD